LTLKTTLNVNIRKSGRAVNLPRYALWERILADQ
jgi:hypothetical protein